MKKETEIQSINLEAKEYGLCVEEDSFLEDKTIWICILSNGLSVYQDDHRPEISEPIAWKRLGRYVKEKCLDIVGIYIKFRSHTEEVQIPENKNESKGVYFSYAITKGFNDPVDKKYYTMGFCNDTHISYDWFLVPEIIKTNQTNRKIETEDIEDGRIIINSAHLCPSTK